MLRVLLLGMFITALGLGLQKGWIEIHWDRLQGDLGVPTHPFEGADPFRSYSKPRQAR
jgi:hypothetical protein